MYREFWKLLIKDYGRLRLAVLLCLVTIAFSILEGVNIGLLIPLLESVQSQDPVGAHWISRSFASLFGSLGVDINLNTMLLALGILILVISGLKYFRLILAAKAQVDLTVWVRSKNMETLLNADMSYFHQQRVGVLSDTLTTQANRSGNSLFMITEIAANVGVIITYVVAAFLISPVLTAVALGTLAVVTFTMQWHISNAKSLGTARFDSEVELQAAALENLSGIHVVKSFIVEPLRWLDFTKRAEVVRENQYRLVRNQSQMSVLQELALFAMIGLIVFVGVSVLSLTIPVIGALLFTLYRLAPRVSGTNNRRQQLVANLASLHQVNQILTEATQPKITNGERVLAGLDRGIELKKVSFSYNGSPPVLQDTSFTIEKGRMTAIVGASGAGKTTLIDMILRFYDPIEGSVLVDGVDLRELDLASWRSFIGVVSQDTFLFNESVANNIALGRPDATNERVRDAATRAYADEFIQQLPDGYDTIIGDRGWNLSGGQRQRISLARAILKDPEILILDEATSSLDSESERLIQEYMHLKRGSCTMVVVAHRMSTIHDADKIVVLQDGKIVEEGTWDALMAKAGVFAQFNRIQSSVYSQ